MSSVSATISSPNCDLIQASYIILCNSPEFIHGPLTLFLSVFSLSEEYMHQNTQHLVAQRITKRKKPHSTGQELVLPVAEEMCEAN